MMTLIMGVDFIYVLSFFNRLKYSSGLVVAFEALFDFFSELLEQVQLSLVFFPFPYK